MKKITLFITAILSCSSFSAFADDLLSVYRAAIQNDPQFRAAHAGYRAQLETKTQSIAVLLPTLSATAHYTEHDNEKVGSTPYEYNTNGYNLTLTQPLYRHENFVGLNQANAQVAQAEATFENAKQDLIIRVATRYFAVLAAEDDLEFALAERKSISRQLVQTEQRFNVGLIAITLSILLLAILTPTMVKVVSMLANMSKIIIPFHYSLLFHFIKVVWLTLVLAQQHID